MPVSMEVCTIDDDYVRDRVRWVVELSNGQTVYEDDNRPGIAESSAWKRLKAYCKDQGVYIVHMWLQFRSNRISVEPSHAKGYFFVKSVFGVWGDVNTYHAYIAGTLVDGQIKATKWTVPELTFLENQTRDVDLESSMLITKDG